MSERKKLNRRQQARIAFDVSNHERLGELVMDRVGGDFQRAVAVLAFVAMYGVFVEQNGREPRSVNELAEAVSGGRVSRATAGRYGLAFREAFPEYSLPTVLWAIAREQVPQVTDADGLTLQLGAVQL